MTPRYGSGVAFVVCDSPSRRWLCYLTGSPESVCYASEQSQQLLNSGSDDLPACSASFQWQPHHATITPRPLCCSGSLLRRRQTLLLSVYLLFFSPFLINLQVGLRRLETRPRQPSAANPLPERVSIDAVTPKQLCFCFAVFSYCFFKFPSSANWNCVRSLSYDWEETENSLSSWKSKCLLCVRSHCVNTPCWDCFS